jgi:hypothetical protein
MTTSGSEVPFARLARGFLCCCVVSWRDSAILRAPTFSHLMQWCQKPVEFTLLEQFPGVAECFPQLIQPFLPQGGLFPIVPLSTHPELP